MVQANRKRALPRDAADDRTLAGGPLNILFVASECAPLAKTGGLADVAGALPLALAGQGCRVRVLMPAYPGTAALLSGTETALEDADLFGGPARVLAGTVGGLEVLLLDAPHLYDREGTPYLDTAGRDWPDNHLRFAALCRIAATIGAAGLADGWRPAVVHAHDWQAGLVPLWLAGRPDGPRTVITVHNAAYQGNFDARLRHTLGLPEAGFTAEGYEFHGRIGFLKAGLVHADAITTVSPTYARELMTPEFGFGLEGVFAARSGSLHGILNGVDTKEWDPGRDPHIHHFGLRTLAARQKNRRALVEALGLSPGAGPVFGVVSRLTWQKGLDLLLADLPGLVRRGASLVLLGAGDGAEEDAFREAAASHPGRVGVRIGYDEALAHRIYASADALLVPSRFEPCGLAQLYALRYGALPVVARTGGLADTVIDANDAAMAAGVATGFHFAPGSAAALDHALERACRAFADRPGWQRMQRNAMRTPVGWAASAARYRGLYDALTGVTGPT